MSKYHRLLLKIRSQWSEIENKFLSVGFLFLSEIRQFGRFGFWVSFRGLHGTKPAISEQVRLILYKPTFIVKLLHFRHVFQNPFSEFPASHGHCRGVGPELA
jgi:hypothetical protein